MDDTERQGSTNQADDQGTGESKSNDQQPAEGGQESNGAAAPADDVVIIK